MKFPSLFSKKTPDNEYFFGLFIKSDEATGFVFESKKKELSILRQEIRKYSSGWDKILEDMDQLVSNLESGINADITKTIFFLHSYLIDPETQEIKDTYKDIIKNIAKGLELKPLGFIELHEVLRDYIRQREEAPLNCIFVELDTEHLSVYVYKGDKQILAQHGARTQNTAEDIQEILSQANNGHTPSKMIVYGGGSEVETVNSLKSFSWKQQLFIQPPKVEWLSESELYEGMRNIFALQLFDEAQPVVDTNATTEESESDSEQQETQPVDPNSVLGFAVGKDVAQDSTYKDAYEEKEEEVQEVSAEKKSYNMKESVGSFISNISVPKGNIALIAGVATVLALVSGVAAFEYFLHKVELTVYVPAKTISKKLDVEAAIGKSSKDFSVNEDTTTIAVTSEKNTTGERDVGQKAKGEVMIHNFDNQEKTLAKGLEISLNNVKFTLDQEVKVASASGVTSGGTKQSGKSKVAATAAEIGPEGNIEKGKELKISDLPQSLYVAIVETSFTGGSRKKVQTVASADLEALEESAIEKAKKESAAKVKASIKAGHGVLADLTEVELSEIEYSKEVGEESSSVTITAKADIVYYTFPESDFKKNILGAMDSVVPDGYKLDESKLSYKVEDVTKAEDEESIDLEVKVTDQAIKDISQDRLVPMAVGKTFSQLQAAFAKEFETTEITIDKVSPPLPIFGKWMPFSKKNISVTISSK